MPKVCDIAESKLEDLELFKYIILASRVFLSFLQLEVLNIVMMDMNVMTMLGFSDLYEVLFLWGRMIVQHTIYQCLSEISMGKKHYII